MNGRNFEVREKILALICLTLIAVLAMFWLTDPENIIVNIIVAIGSFISGTSMRKTDPLNGKPDDTKKPS